MDRRNLGAPDRGFCRQRSFHRRTVGLGRIRYGDLRKANKRSNPFKPLLDSRREAIPSFRCP
jgi:hypothetical protein